MSLELLLILILFVALPLLQQMLRAARQHDQSRPEQVQGQPAPAPRPARRKHPPSAQAPRRAPAPQPLPVTAFPSLPDVPAARERPRAREAPAPHWGARRRTALAGFRQPGSLRRAIVLMTILGPCRANQP
jgi:hypothetical protein